MDSVNFHISNATARKIVLALFIFYAASYSTHSLLRHSGFNSSSSDLAIADQTIWNTSRGRFLETSNEHQVRARDYLAIHFSSILLFFASVMFERLSTFPVTKLYIPRIILYYSKKDNQSSEMKDKFIDFLL